MEYMLLRICVDNAEIGEPLKSILILVYQNKRLLHPDNCFCRYCFKQWNIFFVAEVSLHIWNDIHQRKISLRELCQGIKHPYALYFIIEQFNTIGPFIAKRKNIDDTA